MDIADAENAYTLGRIEFIEFMEQFEQQWFKPLGDMQIGLLLKTITAEERSQLDPEKLNRVMSLFPHLAGGRNA